MSRNFRYARGAAGENSNGVNQSSNQLKMMLGLSSQQAENEAPPAEKQHKNNNNKKVAQEPAPVQQAPAPAAKPAAPAWGGAAANTTTSRKSMSEIQKEAADRRYEHRHKFVFFEYLPLKLLVINYLLFVIFLQK